MYSIDNKLDFAPKPNPKLKRTDYIILVIFAAYFAVDFIPVMKSSNIIGLHYLYFAVLNTLVSIYVLYNKFESEILRNTPTKLYLLFIGICCLSIIVSRNPTESLLSLTYLIIILIAFLNFSILLHNRLYLFNRLAIIISISVFLQAYMVLDKSMLQLTGSKLMQFLSQMKGNAGNINILASSFNVKLPFIIYGIFVFKSWRKVFFMIALVAGSITVFLINARAGLLAFIFELIIFITGCIFLFYKEKKQLLNILYILLPIIISFNISNSILSKTEDTARFRSVGTRLTEIPTETADQSINLRLNYWKNAIHITKENPFLGLGIGNWKIESIPYEKRIGTNREISYNTHNDFLQIMAETGILNSIIYLCIFIFVFFTDIKNIFSKDDNLLSKMISLIIILSLTGYVIDATFNFPLYRPTMQISFALFLALSIANRYSHTAKNNLSIKEIPHLKKIGVFIFILSSISIYPSFLTHEAYKWLALVNYDIKKEKSSFKGKDLEKNMPIFPNIDGNTIPIVEIIARYYIQDKDYDAALIKLKQAKKINPYIGEADWYKASVLLSKGDIDSTYYYFKEAFNRRPRNPSYFQNAMLFAGVKKDTSEIWKIHNEYPKLLENWKLTSKALLRSNYDPNKALNFINTALDEFPKDSTLLDYKTTFLSKSTDNIKMKYLLEANKYYSKKDFANAIPHFKKAEKEDNSDFLIKLNLGICYFYLSNFKEALPYLNQVEQSKTITDGKVEFLLGISYIALKNKTQGCYYLKIAKNRNYGKAIEVYPKLCK